MDRDTFLRRIREQAAIGRNFPVPFNPDATERESYVGGGADLVATFLVEWQGAGGRSYRSPTRAAAQSQISDLLKSMAPTRVLCWRHRLLERLEVARLIQEAGAEVLWWDDLEQRTDSERWELAFSAQFGITSVDWGIAETGSMVMCARPGGQGRAPSLLPPRASEFAGTCPDSARSLRLVRSSGGESRYAPIKCDVDHRSQQDGGHPTAIDDGGAWSGRGPCVGLRGTLMVSPQANAHPLAGPQLI